MEIRIRPADKEKIYSKVSLHLAENERFYTSVSFRTEESLLKVNRKFSGIRRAAVHQKKCKVQSEDGELKLRIILDRYSLEVFANDGEQVMSMAINTDQSAQGISFCADGAVEMDIVKYDLLE